MQTPFYAIASEWPLISMVVIQFRVGFHCFYTVCTHFRFGREIQNYPESAHDEQRVHLAVQYGWFENILLTFTWSQWCEQKTWCCWFVHQNFCSLQERRAKIFSLWIFGAMKLMKIISYEIVFSYFPFSDRAQRNFVSAIFWCCNPMCRATDR